MIAQKIFSKNGVPIHLLQTPKGLSTLGLAVPIGSIHSETSASTSMTFESKLRQALGSSEKAFEHQLYPTFSSTKEYSTFSFNFLQEEQKYAEEVFVNLLDGKPVSEKLFKETVETNRVDDEQGEYTNQRKYFDLGCYSSFEDQRYRNSASVEFADNFAKPPTLNNGLISELPRESILFGTNDMKDVLLKYADQLIKPVNNKTKLVTPKFSPSVLSINHKENLLHGTKVSLQSDLTLASITYPSCGATSKDRPIFDVLTKVFGGGYSFSSEGLGSGYNTILYNKVLGSIPKMRECFAFHFPMSTEGLFTFGFVLPSESFEVAGSRLRETIDTILKDIDENDVSEAKMILLTSQAKQLKNYAERISTFASSLIYDELPTVGKEYANAVRAVTRDDLIRVSHAALSQKPGICIYGEGDVNALVKKL